MRTKEQKAKYKLTADKRIDRLRSQGICIRCAKRPTVINDYCRECADKRNARNVERWKEIRQEVLDHYGAPYCSCCNEKFDYVFLHLDHINGGGNKHRRAFSKNGSMNAHKQVYYEIIRKNFPPGYQALCANCNMAKGLYGECPHKKERQNLISKLAVMPLLY
jgi:hypothetical protein